MEDEAEKVAQDFHAAAQALTDLLNTHVRVILIIDGEPMARKYHPPSCPERHAAPKPTDVPDAFKGLFS